MSVKSRHRMVGVVVIAFWPCSCLVVGATGAGNTILNSTVVFYSSEKATRAPVRNF